jgi:PilZ domain
MPERCSVDMCAEAAAARVEQQPVCRSHFLALSYRRLEAISEQIHLQEFHRASARAARGFLEECMRQAADITGAPVAPDNLERAQVLDVLLWASELHGHLRRGARVPTGIPVLVRSELPDLAWEEETKTQVLSRHGFQINCRRELRVEQVLTCVRLDNGWQARVRVVWTRRKGSGAFEVGLEFQTEENFWGLALGDPAASRGS